MRNALQPLLSRLLFTWALTVSLLSAFGQGSPYRFLTITNPTPAANAAFGRSVAALGDGRLLVGASSGDTGAGRVGAAYLFSSSAALLTTFTNPTPMLGDQFGYSVAVLGSDRLLIGAPFEGGSLAGGAYLFNTNGAFLTGFFNPMVNGHDFGFSIAVVGNDRVLVGAYGNDIGATGAGAAYLFTTNGTLLNTFTNPTPADGDNFAFSVKAVGSGHILVGAPYADIGATNAGAAYLFDINGVLITTFTNPVPSMGQLLGYSVAAIADDRVLLGAWGDATDGSSAGRAYLFNTNGTLLTTFACPTPAPNSSFGSAVAVAGLDRILIGATGVKVGAISAGATYVFSTNGILLNTFLNPTPSLGGAFGNSLAAVDNDRALIGAYQNRSTAGAAYLFNIAPVLNILTPANTVVVSWPSPWNAWTLQATTNDISAPNWNTSPGIIQDDGTNKMLIVTPPTGNLFYRLFRP